MRTTIQDAESGTKSDGHETLSVVMTTRDRPTYLELTLAALEQQTFPTNAWELVIVDCGSIAGTADIVDGCAGRGRIRLHTHNVDRSVTPTEAINHAVNNACGHTIVLLEDDRLVRPDFVELHARHQYDNPRAVIVGKSKFVHTHLFCRLDAAMNGVPANPAVTVSDLASSPKWRNLLSGGLMSQTTHRAVASQDSADAWRLFDCGHASLTRETLMKAGGFDEQFLDMVMAGKDLAFRLHQQGTPFHRAEDIVVLHQVHPAQFDITDRTVLRDYWRLGFKSNNVVTC